MSYNNSNMNIRSLISILGIIIITVFATFYIIQIFEVDNLVLEVEKADSFTHTHRGFDGVYDGTAKPGDLHTAGDCELLTEKEPNSLIRKISNGVIALVIIFIITAMIIEYRKEKNKFTKRKYDSKTPSSSKNNSLNSENQNLENKLLDKTKELTKNKNKLRKLKESNDNIYRSYQNQIQEPVSFFIDHKKKIDEIIKNDKGAALYASLVSLGSLFKYFNYYVRKEGFYKGDESSITFQIGKNVYEIIDHLELNEEERKQCISGIKDKIEQKLQYVEIELFSNSIRFNSDMHERLPGAKHDQSTVTPKGWAIKLKEDSGSAYLKKAPVR